MFLPKRAHASREGFLQQAEELYSNRGALTAPSISKVNKLLKPHKCSRNHLYRTDFISFANWFDMQQSGDV